MPIYRYVNVSCMIINVITRPVMTYASVIWSSCDKESLIQKRAARLILFADRMAPSVELFYRLSWIPIYEQSKFSMEMCPHISESTLQRTIRDTTETLGTVTTTLSAPSIKRNPKGAGRSSLHEVNSGMT